jgi:hypothetical protein
MRTGKTKGRSAAGLTATQIIILSNAKAGPLRFYAGDRLGTRCARYDDDGHACIVAYCNPETTLVRRGLLRPRNERFTYDITDAGREAIAKAEALLAKVGA